MVRGDRDLNETKLQNILGCTELEMADVDIIKEVTEQMLVAGPINLELILL